jgi:hypothetical protein
MRGIFRGGASWRKPRNLPRKVPIRAGIEILAINDIYIAVQAVGNRTVQTGVESDALGALRFLRFLRGTDLLVLAFARGTALRSLRLSRHYLGRAKHAPLGEVLTRRWTRRWRHPMIVEPDVFLPADLSATTEFRAECCGVERNSVTIIDVAEMSSTLPFVSIYGFRV